MKKHNAETALLVRIQDALSATGRCLIWRNSTGGVPTASGGFMHFGLGKGSADLIGVLIPSGRFLGCEVKTPDGHLKPAQIAWHKALTAAGAAVTCVDNVEDALAWLASL